jgi:hypothetical protein
MTASLLEVVSPLHRGLLGNLAQRLRTDPGSQPGDYSFGFGIFGIKPPPTTNPATNSIAALLDQSSPKYFLDESVFPHPLFLFSYKNL